jgi:hypothetical protein
MLRPIAIIGFLQASMAFATASQQPISDRQPALRLRLPPASFTCRHVSRCTPLLKPMCYFRDTPKGSRQLHCSLQIARFSSSFLLVAAFPRSIFSLLIRHAICDFEPPLFFGFHFRRYAPTLRASIAPPPPLDTLAFTLIFSAISPLLSLIFRHYADADTISFR